MYILIKATFSLNFFFPPPEKICVRSVFPFISVSVEPFCEQIKQTHFAFFFFFLDLQSCKCEHDQIILIL